MRDALRDWRAAAERTGEANRRLEAFRAAHPDAAQAEFDEWDRWIWTAACAKAAAHSHFAVCLLLNAGRIGEYDDRLAGLGDDWRPFAMELDGLRHVCSPQGGGVTWPSITVVDPADCDSAGSGRRDRPG
jgi:hypothetical protein